MQLNEIERASSYFRACPKCNSAEGFWIGVKRERAHVQCKGCGAKFELFEVYKTGEQRKAAERSFSQKVSYFIARANQLAR